MDKRLKGKWYKEELGETVNIFDESPLRMKMSFSSSGYYHFEPNCVYEKDGYLCFEINDEDYRMVYHVRYEEGELAGFYTQHGEKTEVRYRKVDDVPEDAPFQYRPTEIYVPETGRPRIDVLKQYSEYDRSREDGYTDEYVFGGEVPAILEKYRYSDYIRDLDSSKDEIVFRLLDFVCDHFGHDGGHGLGNGKKIADLIEFCEKNDNKTNCRGLAILLSALLRLNGIRARHITCMPYEEPFDDCHVVVDCLLPSGKRIMLDPTYRLYLKDSEGEYVSLPHLREMLTADEPIFANADAGYNGTGFEEGNMKEYHRNYMIKNTVRFARCTIHKEGVDGHREGSDYIELVPKGYPTDRLPKDYDNHIVYNDMEFWRM